MQLTPELEAELRLALDTYWNSYLEGDIDTWASYLADEYHNIGTTEEEVWQSKQEIVDYSLSVIQQLQGGAQIRNKTFQFYPIDPYIMVHELGDMYLLHNGDWVFYSRIRMTSLMEKRKEGWKILHQHGSYPDANASHGDVLGFEKIKTENNELREAVQRRTIDLEIKNRELEIEAALERVRAVAMGMKTPNDMFDVCKVISDELEKFGVSHIRNIQTVIISREISQYTCYQYFTQYRLMAVEQTHFERNKVEQALVDRMLDAKGGYFEGVLSGEEMDVFRLHRKRENFLEDPLLDQCEEAFYYFYSIGEGGLGITLYEDLDTEGLSLFKRFHQVFSLAYQRFRDIENAEAQAREAQIEASMEKVRSRSLAMQGPDEIREVAELLRSEMAQLGVEALETSSIYIREPEKDTIECWYAIKDVRGEDSRLVSDEMTLSLRDTWVGQEMQRFLASEEEQVSIRMQGEQRKEWINYCAQRSEALKGYYGTEIPERTYHLVKFAHGFIGAASPGEISAESWRLLKRSASVFSFAYTRFLDLRESAQNAREAQIELGLERVRAKTMAMYKSTQLSETARVLFEQFADLGKVPDRMSIGIVKDELGLIEWWATDQTGSQLTNHFDSSIEQPTVAKIFAGWKEGRESMVIEITGEELKSWVAFVKDKVQMPMDDSKIKGKRVHHAAYFSQGILLISAHEKVQDETMRILVRFAKVFEQAYTRFLDLQKAEAQAREAQIEAALERVRSKTMAMHNSADVGETAAVMVEELRQLGIDTLRCGIGIMHEPGEMEVWTIQTEKEGKSGIVIGTLDMHMHPLLHIAFENWRKKGPQFSYVLEGDDLLGYYGAINNHPGYPIRYDLSALPSRVHHNEFLFPEGVLFSFSLEPLQETQKAIFQRFAGIFGQTYRRYLDLTRAEAQAREAQIEAALEKIRSRSLAMHSSQELIDVIAVVFEKMNELKILMGTVAIWLFDMESVSSTFWLGNEVQGQPSKVSLPYDEGMMNREGCLKDAWEAKRKGENIINKRYDKKLKDEYFDYVFAHNDYQTIPDAARHFIRDASSQTVNLIIERNSTLFVDNWTDQTYSEAQLDIFKRVARVFEQAYVRFLDLQKAEAQARESNIEAALERVRSKAMAMRTSEDIAETTAASFEELRKLGVFSFRSGVGILSKDSRTAQVFADSRAEDDRTVALTTVRSMDEHPALQRQYASWLEQKDFEQVLRGDELRSYYSHSFFKGSSVEQRGVGEQQEEYGYYFAFPDGLFYSWSLEPYSEQEKNILHRFRNIIALTFRRYLDLQKAEAQTREAEIELALERVRARTMAMQKSDELPDAANLLFQQIQSLGMPAWSAGYCLFNEDRSAVTLWMSSEGLLQPPFVAPTSEDELFIQMRKGVEQGVDLHVVEMGGKDLEKHYRYMRSLPVVGEILDSIIAAGHPLPTFQIMHQAYFSKGFLLFITYEPVPIAHEIFKRFAKVFDQTYTRFLDLQKAEIQALEATKQASLDRVRGVISSMRSAEDLNLITPLIFKELTILGVPFIRCGVFIIHEGQQTIEAYLSAPDGHSLGVLNLPFNASDLTYKTVVAWRKNDMLLQHWNKEDFVAWTKQMVSEHQIKDSKTYQGADLPPDSLDLHFVPFAQGMLYVGTMEPLEETKLELVQSLARTFSIAYARYEDFVKLENAKEEIESALTELKATQKQLIQSEKMASLGELTAGIAHEIQNPLNFVNNFSEVSKELIEEVKESIAKGEMADAMDMMADLVQNLEKINEHGKRADSIVKGMLQHSRAGSGQKEATDINVLADECLRLAFHGLRAKDKSFNANFETVFDAEIGKIDVMPQDMGRVLLNLINNAFYTVNEKSKRGEVGYKPMVKVSTEKRAQGIGIRVEDNGDGIPDAIKEKIFQPFFTTKPTGQGTGLGLSLAYDIVKAHGGELTVESKEGEGTVFNIYLPNL